MVSAEDAVSRLRTLLWIGATRSLLARVDEEHDQYLRLVLTYASDELGNLALTPERLSGCRRRFSGAFALMPRGWWYAVVDLAGESDEMQITQLKGGLALDLRGVERLKSKVTAFWSGSVAWSGA